MKDRAKLVINQDHGVKHHSPPVNDFVLIILPSSH
jgi:hypothetical protein